MPSNSFIRRRRPMRLSGYDYTTSGVYFVTICTHSRRPIFNEPSLRLIAEQQWRRLPLRFTHVVLDEWIVMSNHLHGLIVLEERAAPSSSTNAYHGIQAQPKTLGTIVRSYKAAVARRIRARDNSIDDEVWQRGYYDRVVRDDKELDATRQYIENNPLREAKVRDDLTALLERLIYRDH